jgi:hypothetical protein
MLKYNIPSDRLIPEFILIFVYLLIFMVYVMTVSSTDYKPYMAYW